MSLTVGRYTFSAWLRKGIAGSISQPDTLGADGGAVKERATIPVDVSVNATPVHQDFTLLGPGDVLGINLDTVVRTEPRDWVTDFEPNYLAFVEFYDEDFLWRYTPARAVGDRLRPWLALAVLEEDSADHPGEFTRNDRRVPLASITVASSASLPPHTQTWAWAHVHTNEGFASATEFERFLESLQTEDSPNADRIISRLTSPRRLKANTAYGAFVVPAFETGRIAALGQDPKEVSAQQPAWTDALGPVELPVYYQWRFRTGEDEDFESMVKRLVPQAADSRVGIRGMDGEQPGWGLTTGTDIGQILPPSEKQSVVGLEGALKAPTTESRPLAIDSARPFFQELQSVLNFPDAMRNSPSTENLPVVAPPIYGEYHALRHTIDVTQGDWVDDLNRDPRLRVPAGFGVRAIRENQEGYVARAWSQVQTVLEANRLIRLAAYAMRASEAVYVNLAARLAPEQALAFFAPVLRKVRGSPTTLQHLVGESTLPPAAVSGAMRRLMRPRGAIARRIAAADARFTHGALVRGLASGRLTAAPPKQPAKDLMTDTAVVDKLPAPPRPAPRPWWIRNLMLGLVIVLLLLALWALSTGTWTIPTVLAVLAIVVYVALNAWFGKPRPSPSATTGPASIVRPADVAAALRAAPPRDAFRFVESDPVVTAQPRAGTQITTAIEKSSASPNAVSFTQVTTVTPAGVGADTVEARTFRRAAIALEQRLSVTVAERARPPFDIANAHAKLTAAVDPLRAFPRRVAAGVRFIFDPQWLQQAEHLVPAMAYPDFDDPMYEKLRDLSSELLLPNLELIPPNSITLLETNPPFIEAYLTGVNYEFGKELLWREYPTDRRGSYFRQFWDVRGILAEQTGESAASVSERSKDITPLDTWGSASLLGTHRNPQRPPGEQLVLTVRGDLLKKYPNTLIYAQKAHLARDGSGNPRPSDDPVIAPVASDADVQREIRFPVFKASVDPDIRFYGFDLSVEQARGDDQPQADSDDWGYFFIIQQLPGEPRFGMDVSFSPDDDPATPLTWNDLAWTLFPDAQEFIDTTLLPQSFVPAGTGESLSQWGTDSAQMASILYQNPVMIAVHAKEMLAGLA
ncbi:MAG: hypothetical protein ABJD07_08555 [Gemmatimonadaceae bacterium]